MTKLEKEQKFNEMLKEYRKLQEKSLDLFQQVQKEFEQVEGIDNMDVYEQMEVFQKCESYKISDEASKKQHDYWDSIEKFCKDNRCKYLLK